MRGVVSIGDVVDLRRKLSERGLGWTVHLHDACGAQTLSLEALEGAAPLAQAQGAVRHLGADDVVHLGNVAAVAQQLHRRIQNHRNQNHC